VVKRTFLAAGQCYADSTGTPWHLAQHLTILQITDRASDHTQVTYQSSGGVVETIPAGQFEAAIAQGVLVPVVPTGRIATC
jgi:hypothetical protein